MTRPASEAFVVEIQREFPSFRIVYKRESRLQRAIHVAVAILTFGAMRTYATKYHTAMFGKLWVPDSYDSMSDIDRVILLRHERVHLRQRARMGDVVMALVYLIPFLPLFLAYGRARIEWEAYVETIRATAELAGVAEARMLKQGIVRRFTGPDYGWMWPFPSVIGRWFDEEMALISHERPPKAARNGT